MGAALNTYKSNVKIVNILVQLMTQNNLILIFFYLFGWDGIKTGNGTHFIVPTVPGSSKTVIRFNNAPLWGRSVYAYLKGHEFVVGFGCPGIHLHRVLQG